MPGRPKTPEVRSQLDWQHDLERERLQRILAAREAFPGPGAQGNVPADGAAKPPSGPKLSSGFAARAKRGVAGTMAGVSMMAGAPLPQAPQQQRDDSAEVGGARSGQRQIGGGKTAGQDAAKAIASRANPAVGAALGAASGIGGGIDDLKKQGAQQFKTQVVDKLWLSVWEDWTLLSLAGLNLYAILSWMKKPYTVAMRLVEWLGLIFLNCVVAVAILAILVQLGFMVCLYNTKCALDYVLPVLGPVNLFKVLYL